METKSVLRDLKREMKKVSKQLDEVLRKHHEYLWEHDYPMNAKMMNEEDLLNADKITKSLSSLDDARILIRSAGKRL